MKNRKLLFTALILCTSLGLTIFFGFTSFSKQPVNDPISRTVSFDDGWRFLKDSLPAAEIPDFDDSNWRILDVPHDWRI